jgi:hypothetical protein
MASDSTYGLLWSIRYAMRFGRLQARLFDRIGKSIKALTLFFGTAAFVSVVADIHWILAASGLTLALLAILDAIWDPSGRAAKTRELEMRFALLNRDAPGMQPEAIQRAIDELYDPEVPQVEALRQVAYNDTLTESGGPPDYKFQLNGWQRFLAKLA